MSSRVRAREVREASKSEIARISTVLADILQDDPLSLWLHTNPATRHEEMRKGFQLTASQMCWKAGGVHVAVDTEGTLLGAALWTPIPGLLSRIERAVLGYRYSRLNGPRNRLMKEVSLAAFTVAPLRPHWHLLAIATTAEARGKGHGRALLDFGIACADTYRLPTHLETTNAVNVDFYRHAGYELVAELDLPGGGPRSYVMCRETTARR